MQLSQLPTKIAVAFANSGAKNPIPVPSQIGAVAGAASYTDGFPPLTRTPLAAGGVPPSGADMNGVLFEMSAVERWLCAGGQFKYDAAFSTAIGGYPKSSVLNSANSDIQWISTADNNVTDPDSTSAAGWVALAAYGIANVTGVTGGTVTLTPAQYGKPVINLTGALTSNAVIVLPANQSLARVVNNTTGQFTLTVKTAGGAGVVLATGAQDTVYGDGTNIVGNKGSGVKYGAPLAVNATRVLSVAESAGNMIVVAGNSAPISITLPSLPLMPNGAAITFLNASVYPVTIFPSSGDGLNPGNLAVASVVIRGGESFSVVAAIGINWECAGGSAQLPYGLSFAQLMAPNGYKNLPGGFIMQWGQFTQNDNGSTPVNFSAPLPIAFPNAALQGFVSPGSGNSTGGISAPTVEGLATTAIGGFTYAPAGVRPYRYFVIGY